MERVTEASECRKVTDKHLQYFNHDFEAWFSNPDNYAIRDGDNIGFAEPGSNGLYWIHMCFDTAKGRAAVKLVRKMLEQLYSDEPVKYVVGLVAQDNKKACWVLRQAGLISQGVVPTENGPCEMFIESNTNNGIC